MGLGDAHNGDLPKIEICAWTCVETCARPCVQLCLPSICLRNVCKHGYASMHIDWGEGFRHVYGPVYRNVYRNVYGNVYRNVYINVQRHVYRHVYGHVCRHVCRHVYSWLAGAKGTDMYRDMPCRQACRIWACV